MILLYCVMGVWGGVAAYAARDYKLLSLANALAACHFFLAASYTPLP